MMMRFLCLRSSHRIQTRLRSGFTQEKDDFVLTLCIVLLSVTQYVLWKGAGEQDEKSLM